MLMDKFLKGKKLHAYTEYRCYDLVSSNVSGYFSQNLMASSTDNCETFCRLNQGGHVQMSKL